MQHRPLAVLLLTPVLFYLALLLAFPSAYAVKLALTDSLTGALL